MTTMLPAKLYYRIGEVANRWNCTVSDILYYAEEGMLAIALPPEKITERLFYVPNIAVRDLNKSLLGKDETWFPLLAINPEAARGIYKDANGNIIEPEALDDLPEEILKDVLRRHEKEASTINHPFWNVPITVDNLFITHEELKRFERDSQAMTKPTTVCTSKDNLYSDAYISALSQFAEDLLEYLRGTLAAH